MGRIVRFNYLGPNFRISGAAVRNMAQIEMGWAGCGANTHLLGVGRVKANAYLPLRWGWSIPCPHLANPPRWLWAGPARADVNREGLVR